MKEEWYKKYQKHCRSKADNRVTSTFYQDERVKSFGHLERLLEKKNQTEVKSNMLR